MSFSILLQIKYKIYGCIVIPTVNYNLGFFKMKDILDTG